MKGKCLLHVILLGLLCFIPMMPVSATESTEKPRDWIVITYLGDETKEVTIPAGTAIADLWEPEMVYGEEFLYWTYNDDWYSLDGNRRQITKDTIFYESEVLRPVTESTDDEVREMYEFEENWTGAPTEQETEWGCYLVSFYVYTEDGNHVWPKMIDNKELTLANAMEEVEDDINALDGFDDYDFVGWFTDSNNGIKITKDTPVTEDIDVYAHWEEKSKYGIVYLILIIMAIVLWTGLRKKKVVRGEEDKDEIGI